MLEFSNTSLLVFSFPAMFYLPCADHVILFVDDVVTSWPQTKISDWSEIKCIVILAVQNRTCSIPKCVIMQLLKVAWCIVKPLFTLYFLVYDTSIMILAFPCNRSLTDARFFHGSSISFVYRLYCWYIDVNKKMWYKICFIGKFKIMLIVNEITFLRYFNIVIQSLDRLGPMWCDVCLQAE